MAKGRLLKTKIKEALKVAEATELGKQIGDFKGQKRKPLEVSLKEHIGKFIDNILVSDMIEISAWLGLAYLIKPILQTNAEIKGYVAISKASHYATGAPGIGGADAVATWLTALLIREKMVAPEQAEAIAEDVKKADLEMWLLALAISALIMKFGPSILQSMGGIVKLGSLLLQ